MEKHITLELTLKEAKALQDYVGNSWDDIVDNLEAPSDIAACRRAGMKLDEVLIKAHQAQRGG